MKLLTFPLVLVLLASLALAACGKSKEDKAMSSVCDARADISKQIDHLKGLTIGTATLSDVQNSLKAIGDDLTKIKDAQGDLSEPQAAGAGRQREVLLAGQGDREHGGQEPVADNAKTQLQAALTQLADAYKTTLGPIDCS